MKPFPWCDQVSPLGDCPAGEIQDLGRLMGSTNWIIRPSGNDDLVSQLGTPRPPAPACLHLGPPALLPPALAARGTGNAGVKFSDLLPVDGEEARSGDRHSTRATVHLNGNRWTLFPAVAASAEEFCGPCC